MKLKEFAEKTPYLTHDLADGLKRFSKLSEESKNAVLLGESRFTVVMWDIEATNLSANVGRIICCSFKPIGGEVYTLHALQPGIKKPDVYDDSALCVAIRNELERYDIAVGWNSKMFDLKYINARCMRVGERTKRAGYHVDGMWSWRSKARAWSGLASVQHFVGASQEKTVIDWAQWMRVLGWNKALREEAMQEIVEHCEIDVEVLEEVYCLMVKAGAIRGLRKDGGI